MVMSRSRMVTVEQVTGVGQGGFDEKQGRFWTSVLAFGPPCQSVRKYIRTFWLYEGLFTYNYMYYLLYWELIRMPSMLASMIAHEDSKLNILHG